MGQIIVTGITIDEFKELISSAVENKISTLNNSSIEETTEYLTREEVATLLKISKVTLDKLTKKGILSRYMFGRNIRYKKSEVDKMRSDNFSKYKKV